MAILADRFPNPSAVGSGDDVYRNRRPHGNNVAAYLFLGPQLLGLVVFMVGPLLFALVSGDSTTGTASARRSFAGLSNFADLSSPAHPAISGEHRLVHGAAGAGTDAHRLLIQC